MLNKMRYSSLALSLMTGAGGNPDADRGGMEMRYMLRDDSYTVMKDSLRYHKIPYSEKESLFNRDKQDIQEKISTPEKAVNHGDTEENIEKILFLGLPQKVRLTLKVIFHITIKSCF